ncbi:heterokaryon incompatibility protein-domain-containing protein [Pyrenochaeta sp. MPI-SDFR-AT-0127]|nr:heterokaryon incompatibility protein-domain-containing protein [Pyrenochaeta sp. MPI-SDFR-AT-0127]
MESSENTTSYPYKSVGSREIRLIDIHRDSSGDLHVDIKHCSLDEAPPYEALSYCWGEAKDRALISCNGHQMSIMKSLHEALSQFRATMKENVDRRTIWADAICIDQSNTPERNQQVLLMGEVYRNAQRVIVWLGHADAESCERFEFAVLMLQDNNTLRPGLLADDIGERVMELLSSPWFTRTWVVQEVGLAKEAILYYGSTEITWVGLVELCTKLQSIIGPTARGSLLLMNVFNLEQLRNMFHLSQNGSQIQPYRHLQACRYKFAKDPRDKVYGLIGFFSFAPHGQRFAILPEYQDQNTKQDVYLDFAIKSLQISRNLDILSVPRAPVDDGLPSWAPRWDLEAPVLSRDVWTSRVEYTKRRTIAGTFSYQPEFSADLSRLRLSGHIIDTIEEVGPVCRPPQHEEAVYSKTESLTSVFTVLYDESMKVTRADTTQKYHTGETLLDAHWKTMIAGSFRPEEEHDMRADFTQIRNMAKLNTRLEKLGLHGVKAMSGPRKFLGGFAIILFGGLTNRENRDRFWRRGAYNYPGHDLRSMILNRRFMRTKGGFIGIAPELASAGDSVGVFEGGKVPLLLRPKGDDWELIGDSYVHGIMEQEAFSQEKCKEFWLV